jgi:hypothetical protein
MVVDICSALILSLQRPRMNVTQTPLEDAKQIARFWALLAAASTGSALSKHVPMILVGYVRAVCDPFAGLSVAIRKELEPGLFSICDVITAGGRGGGRGREGEGLGLSFGLGEGGEAEKEVWADLWKAWARKRYTGRG